MPEDHEIIAVKLAVICWVDPPARKSVNQCGRIEDLERRLIKWGALQSYCTVQVTSAG